MPRIRRERVCGPYYDDSRRDPWSVHFINTDGRRRVVRVATEEEARRLVADGRSAAQGERTVSEAIAVYVEHKRSTLRPGSVVTLEYRLGGMLRTSERDLLLRDVTPALAARLYEQRTRETKADTHRGELAACSSFAAWAIKRGWLRVNPFTSIEPVGRRATGKPQLRVDEARRFLAAALDEQSPAGLAAAMALLLGLRASEVTDRTVRDVDDGGALLWVDQAKTSAGVRRIIVPPVLRPRLAELVCGRGATERLWGDVDRHWLGRHVRRLCEVAQVPAVTPHGLRGLHATLAVGAGADVAQVAAALGHTGPAVTRRHYVAAGTEEAAGHERALAVIQGGRR